MNKKKETPKISRTKMLFILDKSQERMEELELHLLELQVTANAMEKFIEERFGPYIQKKKPFTRKGMDSYKKALDELQRLRTNGLAIQKELQLWQILHQNRIMRFRRMETKQEIMRRLPDRE